MLVSSSHGLITLPIHLPRQGDIGTYISGVLREVGRQTEIRGSLRQSHCHLSTTLSLSLSSGPGPDPISKKCCII